MSDLEDEINNATISFVPQIGPGADKKKKKASHEEEQPQQQQQQPPAPMIGFQSFPPPPNPYAAQSPYYAAGPPMKQPMNGGGMMMFAPGQQQEMMFVGQPVMGMMPYPPTAPMSPYNAYPQAAAYAPGQPGAMVLLVQEMPDVDFQAPFCGCNSCVGCLNHTFLTYCQLARQQNMIEVLSQDPTALQVSANGCKTYVNEARAQQNVGRVKNVNGCCAFASVFDAVSLAVGFFFPQFGGSMCGTGLCIQTIQVRQQIRRRFGIMPHQIQDVCAGCCFPWCASQQQQQEFQLRMANCKLVCGDEMPVRPLRPMQ